MKRTIIWSELAVFEFEEICDYLKNKWSESSRQKFIKKVDEVLIQIKSNPGISNLERSNPEIRSRLIHPRSTLYFEVLEEKIILLSFFNNSRDPASRLV